MKKGLLFLVKKFTATLLVLMLLFEPTISSASSARAATAPKQIQNQSAGRTANVPAEQIGKPSDRLPAPRGRKPGGGFTIQSEGGTSVGGTISQDTTWTLGNSPYVVNSSVIVNEGVTLTIEPGTIVKFAVATSLTANGTLVADGTSGDKIYFTSIKDDTAGGDTNGDGTATVPAKGDWYFIKFMSSSTNSILDNTVVKYAGYGYDRALSVYANMPITNSTISSNKGYAIATGTNVTLDITGNTATGNDYNGIAPWISGEPTSISQPVTWRAHDLPYVINASLSVGTTTQTTTLTIEPGTIVKFAVATSLTANGTLVADGTSGDKIYFTSIKDDTAGGDTNGDGTATVPAKGDWYFIKFMSSSTNSILDNTVVKYAGYGYDRALEVYANMPITNSTISSNRGYAIAKGTNVTLDHSGNTASNNGYNGIATLISGQPTSISQPVTWQGHDLPYIINNSLEVGTGTTLTIEPDTIVKFAKPTYLTIKGTLVADGTSSDKIYFTSIKDDTAGGDTNGDGTATVPAKGDWYYIKFMSTSTNSSLSSVDVGYAGYGYNRAIYINGSSPSVKKSTIREIQGRGIYTDNNANPIFKYNDIYATTSYRLYNAGPGTVDARYNWWGSQVAFIGGSVLIEPWSTVPYKGDPKNAVLGFWPRAVTFAGDPVNTSTGNFAYDHEDLALSGKDLALNFTRSYNSQDTLNNGTLGKGWTHNYNTALRFDESSATTVFYPDGRRVIFDYDGGDYTAPAEIPDRLVQNADSSFTLTLPDQVRYYYNGSGRLTMQVDKYGNTTTLNYNASKLLQTVTDPSGRTLTFTYNANNYISQVSDSAGRSVSYTYDTTGNLTNFIDARSKTTTYTYDADSQLTSIKESGMAKPIWRNFYTDGRVTTQLDAFDTTYTFSYDLATKKTTLIDRRGNESLIEYDDRYWTTKATDPFGFFEQFAFGSIDLPLTSVDKRNNTTAFSYDANGNTTSTIDQEGNETQASYDLTNNNLLWQKDALGRQTTYTYDATGTLLESIASPIGNTAFDYFGDGLVKTVTDDNSHTTDFAYNTAGNLTKITDALSSSTTMDYDLAGRMTTLTAGEGEVTSFSYNANGDILSIKDPLSLIDQGNRHQVDFTYDGRGNQTGFIDADSNDTSFTYDLMNNLSAVVDADDATTTYGYDPNYNLSSVTDAESHTTLYGYDANDRLNSTTDALGYDTRYGYDPSGNLTETVWPNGNESYYEFFKDNLLKRVSYNNDSRTYDFTYNPTHTLKDVTDNSARVWAFGYDDGDRLTVTTDPISASLGDFVINRSYDGASNLTGIKAGAESTVAYGYNDRYDLTDLDLPGASGDISFDYDKARKRTNIAMPGSVSDFGFDAAGRVTTVTVDTSSTDLTFAYSHDANGNILSQNGTGYRYDALNRLTDWFNPDSDTTTTYAYDKVGNLTEVKENGVTTKTLSYNAANQIDSSGYGYDVNGNMTTDTANVYRYDGDNRLTAVLDKSTETTIAAYAYDFMGRRISSTDASGTTTYFHYDGWNLVAESDASGTITARYYYDEKGQIMAMKKDGYFYYYQFNAHGDVVSLTDGSGTVVNSYEYDPWGNPLSTSETVGNPYRYAGYRYDGDTGLYYLRSRYYSPGDYRFLTTDLWPGHRGTPLSLNPYLYAIDNPVNLVDPTGRSFALAVSFFGGITMPAWVPWAAVAVGVAYLGYRLYSELYRPPGGDDAWKWRGKDQPGGNRGRWVHPETKESWHPHPNSKHGPHWDVNVRGCKGKVRAPMPEE